MTTERPDLDGRRLYERDRPDVWLIFHGLRHRIASPSVYDALFSEIEGLTLSNEIETIALGEELGEGACLIRVDGTLPIHLLTRIGGEVRRLFIPTYESLLDFAFDEGKVREIPPLLLEAVPAGEELTSAADRANR